MLSPLLLVFCSATSFPGARSHDVLPSEFNTANTMRAAVLTNFSSDFKVHLEKIGVIDLPIPQPGHGEVLVQVRGSSVNPADLELITSPAQLLWQFPHRLGFDVAGVVAAVGPSCTGRLVVDDEVWAMMTSISDFVFGGGSWAEYVVVAENLLAKKPQALNFTDAGALPAVALTGLVALEWAADPSTHRLDNMTVVVLGGSGGTGHVGIQIAKAFGAKEVITTCSATHIDFVKSLGADLAIDYHKENWTSVVPDGSVDVVYDCVGQVGTGDEAFPKLRNGGRFVTLQPRAKSSVKTRLKRPDVKENAHFLCVQDCPSHEHLEQVGKMVDAGQLKVHVDQNYNLADVRMAVNHSYAGHTTGKVAITVAQSPAVHIII